MPQQLVKNLGVTPAERYLQRLCEKTFLSLWSYAGLYRDQRSRPQGEGKELCDLLVVFENTVLIFSDKHCCFPRTGNIRQDWQRWFRRAILKSAEQAWGAERWIREHPARVFLNSACTKRFPFSLPTNPEVHLLAVAHDVAPRCREQLGGSGSLMFRSDLQGIPAHLATDAPIFTVGDLDCNRTFVHVLDDTSLDILMRTVDTIADFVAYLSKKIRFLRSRPVFAAGEEELLAFYLKRMNADDQHDFVTEGGLDGVWFLEGLWEAFESNPQRLAQIEADRPSYSWDRLIETFSRNAMAGTHHFPLPDGLQATERIMRFMARESRTRRRVLARSLLEMIATTPDQARRTRVGSPSLPGDPFYVFLLIPRGSESYDDYRRVRLEWLYAACQITKLKCPEALDIVGIATETGSGLQTRSEDAVYFDARAWSEANAEEARELREKLELLTNTKEFHWTEKEYPDIVTDDAFKVSGEGRNKPCPCGSGKKWKKCHGKP
jgi:hypothetical protein